MSFEKKELQPLRMSKTTFLDTMEKLRELRLLQWVPVQLIPEVLQDDLESFVNNRKIQLQDNTVRNNDYVLWLRKLYSPDSFDYSIHWPMEKHTHDHKISKPKTAQTKK